MNYYEEFTESYEFLSEAFQNAEDALHALQALPEIDPEIDKNLMIGTCEDLMELIAKSLEGVQNEISTADAEAEEQMRRDSYNW